LVAPFSLAGFAIVLVLIPLNAAAMLATLLLGRLARGLAGVPAASGASMLLLFRSHFIPLLFFIDDRC